MKRNVFSLFMALSMVLGQCCIPAHAEGQGRTSRSSKYALYFAGAVFAAGALWFGYNRYIKRRGPEPEEAPDRSESADSNVSGDSCMSDLGPEPDVVSADALGATVPPLRVPVVLEEAARESIVSVKETQRVPEEPAPKQVEPAKPAVSIVNVSAIRAQAHREARARRATAQEPAPGSQKDGHVSMWSGLDEEQEEEKYPEPDQAELDVYAQQEQVAVVPEADRAIFEKVKRRHRLFFPNTRQTKEELVSFSRYYHFMAGLFEKLFNREPSEDEVLSFSEQFKAFKQQASDQREPHFLRFERCYSEFREYNNDDAPSTEALLNLDWLFARFEQAIHRAPQGTELFQFNQYHQVYNRYPHDETELVTFIME